MTKTEFLGALLAAYGERLALLERDQRAKCSEGPGARRWHAERSSESKALGGERRLRWRGKRGGGSSSRETALLLT